MWQLGEGIQSTPADKAGNRKQNSKLSGKYKAESRTDQTGIRGQEAESRAAS